MAHTGYVEMRILVIVNPITLLPFTAGYLGEDRAFRGRRLVHSQLAFGKFKGRLYQEAREDAELRAWLEWLAESTNEWSSALGRWYLGQLENCFGLEDAVFLDLRI